MITADQVILVHRAANEGIPIAAIARILQQPFDEVLYTLELAKASGAVASVPKSDWPPSTHWDARLPSVPRTANAEDIEFRCRNLFKLSPLEGGFVTALIRHEWVDKDQLFSVVGEKRQARLSRPNSDDMPDPKIVDVIICKLRPKLLAVDPGFKIETTWGKGYYFKADVKRKIFELLGDGNAGTGTREAQNTGARH